MYPEQQQQAPTTPPRQQPSTVTPSLAEKRLAALRRGQTRRSRQMAREDAPPPAFDPNLITPGSVLNGGDLSNRPASRNRIG